MEDQLSNEIVPYHETKAAIPEFEVLGWPLAAQLFENDEIASYLITCLLIKEEQRFTDQNVP